MNDSSPGHTQYKPESHDGRGAADHDVPFEFGRLPHALATFPFSTLQFAHLLVLRSRFQAGLFGGGDI